jgi:periplasmic protein TonB
MNDAAASPLQTSPLQAFAIDEPQLAGPENRRFTHAVIAALALHLAALAFAILTPSPRQMGEETGSPEGLTVEIVDPSEVPGATPRTATPLPAAPSQPPQPEQTQPEQAQPATEPTPPSAEPAVPPPAAVEAPATPDLKPAMADDAPALEQAPPEPTPAPVPPKTAAAKLQPDKPVAIDTTDPNLFKIQPNPQQPPQPKTATKPRATSKPASPAAKQPQLSMTLPTPAFSAADQGLGRSAGVSRPEGITRSGLNDEFGRGVIRALRQTMPPNDKKAQATVKFVLSPDGNLLEVQLVASSGDPILDQNVVFAVKQSNFPIPATNLTALDRQFRVTYIYR